MPLYKIVSWKGFQVLRGFERNGWWTITGDLKAVLSGSFQKLLLGTSIKLLGTKVILFWKSALNMWAFQVLWKNVIGLFFAQEKPVWPLLICPDSVVGHFCILQAVQKWNLPQHSRTVIKLKISNWTHVESTQFSVVCFCQTGKACYSFMKMNF